MRRASALVLAALAATVGVRAQSQSVRVAFAGRPQLVNCNSEPCFRFDVQLVDERGAVMPLPENPDIRVFEGPREYRVFYKVGFRTDRSAQPAARPDVRRYALLVVDTSGSMKDRLASGVSKYDAALDAIERYYLGNLQDGVDYMAIVPFNSRRVTSRVRAAEFATSRDAMKAQLGDLGAPAGNTALYSAADEALAVLEKQKGARPDYQFSLVLFTDGANDVGRPGDDPGLLGPEGLGRVRQRAEKLGVPVYTIGFGSGSRTYDAAALRQLAYPDARNFLDARDESQLAAAFKIISQQTSSTERVRLTTVPIRTTKDQLFGQEIVFDVQVGPYRSPSPPWRGPTFGAVTWDVPDMSASESSAFIKCRLDPACLGGGRNAVAHTLLRRLAVLAGFAVLLALMWFALPRAIWPERYVPKPALASAAARHVPARPPSARPPAPGPAPRAPAASQRSVTLGGRGGETRPVPPPPPPAPAAGAAPRLRESPAAPRAPGRVEGSPRVRDAVPPPRDMGDATVFLPPKKPPRAEE